MIQTLQPLHHCSVGYQPRTIWLTSSRRLFLQTNRRKQTRKCKRAIWNCKYESDGKVGVQELDSKGLIDIVEEIKNGGLGSMYKDFSPQIQWCNLCFSKGNTRTKQNPNLSGGGYWVYRRTRWPRVGVTRGGRPQLGLKARHDTRAIGPKEVAQHLSRFWTSNYFMNFCWLQVAMDLNMVALERLWNYLSNHIKFSSNGLRMWLWHCFWCRLFLESEKETKSKL